MYINLTFNDISLQTCETCLEDSLLVYSFFLSIAPQLNVEDLKLDFVVHRIVLDGCMIKGRRLLKLLKALQDSFLIKLLFTCLRFVLLFPYLPCLIQSSVFDFNYAPFQDESLLVNWKQQLDRDSETLKMKGNLNCLRTVSTHY